jgi:hypothetical protein
MNKFVGNGLYAEAAARKSGGMVVGQFDCRRSGAW